MIDNARFAESKPLYDAFVKDMIGLAYDEVPRVPMFQPTMDVAMQKDVMGYQYWFHLQPRLSAAVQGMTALMNAAMTPEEIASSVDATARLIGLPIAAEHRDGVLRYFGIAATLAQLVMDPPADARRRARGAVRAGVAGAAVKRSAVNALLQGPAHAISTAVRRRELKVGEIVAAAAERISATDERINAFTALTLKRATTEAAELDARIAAGEASAAALPLLGVPYAVKNLFDIDGLVTVAGTKIERDAPPAKRDAVLVQRLQAAGAVLVGALNMDEYAYGFTTENTHYGPCRNPHDLTRISGGSSGGSAAAIAAGQVPLTLGSGHQRQHPRAVIAVRHFRAEAHLRPAAAHRQLPVRRQPGPPGPVRPQRARPGAGLRRDARPRPARPRQRDARHRTHRARPGRRTRFAHRRAGWLVPRDGAGRGAGRSGCGGPSVGRHARDRMARSGARTCRGLPHHQFGKLCAAPGRSENARGRFRAAVA